jgi:2-polyprenyl-6-methoxyphenol hydroxylase-like FAD-dependent oxidoreductase
MARIIVPGGGVVGLCTAMLLAGDGHEVTVLERDPAPPPEGHEHIWTDWQRRGVNQFHMVHFFLPRFRQVVIAELPEVAGELRAAGALELDPLEDVPEDVRGPSRPDDARFVGLTGRRPVVEAALSRVAARTPGVRIERGTTVAELLTGAEAVPGVPHVVGVRTDDGTERPADLVVDATGRRSPLPRWLVAAGARPPLEAAEDSGFVYYGKHFRSADGAIPPAIGPLLQHYGSISTLTLPADNGTWGVAIVASASDAPLRALTDVGRWDAALRAFPLVAHWADGEPIRPKVDVMAKIEDRHRRFVVDGTPVATGVAPVGDSWACTNPSLGRGASMGILHAVALRDLLRHGPLDEPAAFAVAWDEATEQVVAPWYRSTVATDRHRLHEIEADIQGRRYEADDEVWELTHAMLAGAGTDPEVLRATLRMLTLHDTPEALFADTDLAERIRRAGGGWRSAPPPGPDRKGLLATIGA